MQLEFGVKCTLYTQKMFSSQKRFDQYQPAEQNRALFMSCTQCALSVVQLKYTIGFSQDSFNKILSQQLRKSMKINHRHRRKVQEYLYNEND